MTLYGTALTMSPEMAQELIDIGQVVEQRLESNGTQRIRLQHGGHWYYILSPHMYINEVEATAFVADMENTVAHYTKTPKDVIVAVMPDMYTHTYVREEDETLEEFEIRVRAQATFALLSQGKGGAAFLLRTTELIQVPTNVKTVEIFQSNVVGVG